MELFTWLNDQLLRMDWLAWLVRVLLEDGLGLDMTSRSAASLHFFIYDVIKIFILLAVLIVRVPFVWEVVGLANTAVSAVEQATLKGSSYMFGYLGGGELPFALKEGAQPPLVVVAASWNVNSGQPGARSLEWLRPAAQQADIVAVALQEVEAAAGVCFSSRAVEPRALCGGQPAGAFADAAPLA